MKNNTLLKIFMMLAMILATLSCKRSNDGYDNDKQIDDEQPPAEIASANYTINFDQPKQTILGLGFEIQSDAFGQTYENDDLITGVPYDLLPSERTRMANEMLKGFRYMRVAMGLWFRGLTEDRKNIVERYPNQISTLKQMMDEAGVEGISLEYWSPAPAWKASNSYRGNVEGTYLKCFDGSFSGDEERFLDDFGNALVKDLQYMEQKGFKVSTWGLQNEPRYENTSGYSHCYYSPTTYLKTFKAVAPKIREASPNTEIIVDSNDGNVGQYAAELKKPENAHLLDYVDAWVYHRIGDNSDFVMQRKSNYLADNRNKPIYQNEYEYFTNQVEETTPEWRMVNTAQSIMNWMTFIGSQKWYWLHALKPTTEYTNTGFSLGFYRPPHDTDFSRYPDLQPGYFSYNWSNFNGIAGFLKYMDWNSVRYEVEEAEQRADNRIMAWKKPDGKFVLAVTNRSDEWFQFNVKLDKNRSFTGYRYSKDDLNKNLSKTDGLGLSLALKPWSVEFWVEE